MVEHDGCLRGFECHRYLILGRGPGPTLNFTSRNAGSGPPHGFTAAVTSWGFRLCSNQPSASHTCPLLGQAETDIPLLIHSRCGARCLAESCIFHPHRADGDGGGCGLVLLFACRHPAWVYRVPGSQCFRAFPAPSDPPLSPLLPPCVRALGSKMVAE